MELEFLKYTLQKFKASETLKVFERWSFMSKQDVQDLKSLMSTHPRRSLTKMELIKFCKDKKGLTMEHIGELDLICLYMHSTKRQWHIYHLLGSYNRPEFKNTMDFKNKLMQQMRLYFNKYCSVSILLHDGLLWGRVYIPALTLKKCLPSRCLYFIYYPQTPFVILTGMTAVFSDFISKVYLAPCLDTYLYTILGCLTVALGYRDFKEFGLTGHHFESLAELALNSVTESGYKQYLKMRRLHGPLTDVISRKRKTPQYIEHDGILDWYKNEKRQRRELLDRDFGAYVPPALEKIEYRVELPYRSRDIMPDLRSDGKNFNLRVQFCGTNVLEGIRNLADSGYAKVPLPKHLTCAPSRARNHFVLARPQKSTDLPVIN